MKHLLFVATGMIVLSGASALACSCVAPGRPLAELEKSNSVFMGTVESIKSETVGEHGWKQNVVTLKIDRSWKGLNQYHSKMTVRTSAGGASCGFSFKSGESYVVYAGLSLEGQVTTSGCSRTSAAANASEDFKDLGEGKKPR